MSHRRHKIQSDPGSYSGARRPKISRKGWLWDLDSWSDHGEVGGSILSLARFRIVTLRKFLEYAEPVHNATWLEFDCSKSPRPIFDSLLARSILSESPPIANLPTYFRCVSSSSTMFGRQREENWLRLVHHW